VAEAICIGQDWDDDVRVVLFVRLADASSWTMRLRQKFASKIRTGASPRLPSRPKIISVSDIPADQIRQDVELAVARISFMVGK